jgi:hypothetical protein
MMGRKPKKDGATSASKQTIEGISDDQRYSLVEQHRQTFERLLATKKAADAALRNHGKIIRADLGKYGMDEIKGVMEGSTPEGEISIKARIERDVRILRWMQVPIGSMEDLFPANDRTPLVERAYADGKRQGLAGGSQNNPHHHTTAAAGEHDRGYADGQQTLATKGFSKLEDDDGPKGSVPKDKWAKDLRDQNETVQKAIKSGAVDSLAAH